MSLLYFLTERLRAGVSKHLWNKSRYHFVILSEQIIHVKFPIMLSSELHDTKGTGRDGKWTSYIFRDLLKFFKERFIELLYVCVCAHWGLCMLSVCMSPTHMQESLEVRGEHQVPWSWNNRQLELPDKGSGNWTLVPCKSRKCSSTTESSPIPEQAFFTTHALLLFLSSILGF